MKKFEIRGFIMKEIASKKKARSSKLRKYFKTTKSVHNQEPDYARPRLEIPPDARERMFGRLCFLYGTSVAKDYMLELERILKVYYAHKPQELLDSEMGFDPTERFTEEDVILITYGDLLHGKEHSPLATLAKFCHTYLQGTINTLHILPFFPYSSDKGFAIIDFETVDPNLGSWQDIEDLENHYQLMFDGVINHVSSKCRWFQEFLNDNPNYQDFFTAFASPDDLTPEERKLIFRPRTCDILTEFTGISGAKYVWTTFSHDQIDLNFKNPNVLMCVIEILLLYVRHGADIIRLDAVTYLWDQPGTPGIHLEQTHEIVKLFRDILNVVAPGVALITETNVPHEENISYFGNGHDEAQMVYNFALPPLVLHAFYMEDATILSRWAQDIKTLSNTTTFFNFLDSHDGIGVMGAKNILPQKDMDFIIRKAKERGGYISNKTGQDGAEEPYEINITWYSALNQEDADEDTAFQVKRFIASRSIALVFQGVPGIYLHSLLGTRNDIEGVLETGSKRAINRTIIDYQAITQALKDPLSKISLINQELGKLITIRTKKRAFHPNADQHVLLLSPKIFTVLKISPERDQHILTLTNVTSKACDIDIPISELSATETHWCDIVTGKEWIVKDQKLHITMDPYDVIWLEALRKIEKHH